MLSLIDNDDENDQFDDKDNVDSSDKTATVGYSQS